MVNTSNLCSSKHSWLFSSRKERLSGCIVFNKVCLAKVHRPTGFFHLLSHYNSTGLSHYALPVCSGSLLEGEPWPESPDCTVFMSIDWFPSNMTSFPSFSWRKNIRIAWHCHDHVSPEGGVFRVTCSVSFPCHLKSSILISSDHMFAIFPSRVEESFYLCYFKDTVNLQIH